MSGGVGRPNRHAHEARPAVSISGTLAHPNAPVGGTGRGQSRSVRARDMDSSWTLGQWTYRHEEIVGSVVHRGEQFVHHSEDELYRARDVYEAAMLGLSFVPSLARAQIGVDIEELMPTFVPGVLLVLVILGDTTLLGAPIGAAIGSLAGSLGSLPGAALSGDIGLDAGSGVFEAMGISFLLPGLSAELPAIFERVERGIRSAWNSGHDPRTPGSKDVENAAFHFANAATEFLELVVQGSLAYLLRSGWPGDLGKIDYQIHSAYTTDLVAARSREVAEAIRRSPGEVNATRLQKIAELDNDLRKAGRWITGLSPWLNKHFNVLVQEFEKRHPKPYFEGSGSTGEQTDPPFPLSERKPKKAESSSPPPAPEPPTFASPINAAAQAAALVAAAAQGRPFCPQ